MKSRVFPLFVIFLAIALSSCTTIRKISGKAAIETDRATYGTVFIAGRAPIEIDGDISEWEKLGIPAESITEIIPSATRKGISVPEDLSAEFMACLDSDYLYVAVQVADDSLVCGEDVLSSMWADDVVEIYFDGDLTRPAGMYSANSGHVMISKYLDGELVLEGRIGSMPKGAKPDLFYEACGTVCALEETGGDRPGYIVEIAIPRWIFSPDVTQDRIGFNVIVGDDDDGGESDSKISWSRDPERMSPMESGVFGIVSIDRILGGRELGEAMTPRGKGPTVPEEFRRGVRLVADGRGAQGRDVLGRIFLVGERDLIWKASTDLIICSLEKDIYIDSAIYYAEELLESDISGRARLRALSELAYLYERKRDYQRAIRLREQILEESGGREISQMIDIGSDYMDFDPGKARMVLEDALESPYANHRIREKAITILSDVYVASYEYELAEALFEDAFGDPEINREKILLPYGNTLFRIGKHREAAEVYRHIIETRPLSSDARKARKWLTHCHRAMRP